MIKPICAMLFWMAGIPCLLSQSIEVSRDVLLHETAPGRRMVNLDSCTQHDRCIDAIPIYQVVTDSAYICINGCSTGATPDIEVSHCYVDTNATVWYRIIPDANATMLNLRLYSADISIPRIQVFHSDDGCNNLVPLGPCRKGFTGRGQIAHVPVTPLDTFYIAIVAEDTIGGTFALCVNTNSTEVECYSHGDIDIVSRESGNPVEDPLLPGELISVCMTVLGYEPSYYGCQWLQGMIPSFGPAWSHASFDTLLQPFNVTIDTFHMGDTLNGRYGASTWDWFTDVRHHGESQLLQIGDVDGDGDKDVCHALYEDCPDWDGLEGACCRPCYADTAGTLLPPGWFAYGINGSCATKNHPRVDWGDGASCYETSGPWSICFDLKVSTFPECLAYPADSGLKLKFTTKSDVETGGTTGDPEGCIADRPEVLLPAMACGTPIEVLLPDTLHAICSGEEIVFQIQHSTVSHWYWNVDPLIAVSHPYGDGENGTILQEVFTNASHEPVWITYHFRGLLDSADAYVTKQITVEVLPALEIDLPQVQDICKHETGVIQLAPVISGGSGIFEQIWIPTGSTQPILELHPPHVSQRYHIIVSDEYGCIAEDSIMVVVDENCFQDPQGEEQYDESNDPQVPQDPIPTGNVQPEIPAMESRSNLQVQHLLVYPVPAHDIIIIELLKSVWPGEYVGITDPNGRLVKQITASDFIGKRKSIFIHDWVQGVYYVHYHAGESVSTARFVKM